MTGALAGALAAAWLSAAPPAAVPAPAVFAVHIGINQAPAGSALPALRYADDDAVRFYRFTQTFTEQAWLVTVFDDQTARRHRDLLGRTVAPHRRGVETVLDELQRALADAETSGRRRVVMFSFSGHGVMGPGGAGLALLDGALDRSFLVEKVAALPADEVHLFFDACHAEGVVGEKGAILQEQTVATAPADPRMAARVFADDFFARHPHIGAVLASAADQQTHEWSRLEGGVFTHEVLSALRGSADINGDGQVAYSELSAFVAAANRSVADQKAVPRLITRPPQLNPGAVLVDASWLRASSFVVGEGGAWGHFYIERDDGLRVLDAHLDAAQRFRVAVPAGETLWVRTADNEARLALAENEVVDLADLALRPVDARGRGSVATSLQAGLFQAPFGRAYYAGWVDSQGLLPVAFAPVASAVAAPVDGAPGATAADAPTSWAMITTLGLLGGAGVAAVVGAAAGVGMAVSLMQFHSTDLQAPAAGAAGRFYVAQNVAAVSGIAVVLLAGAAGGAALWWAAE